MALLDSYEAERKPHVIATTQAAIALGRVICERDADAARARDDRLLTECGGVVPTTIRQSMLPGLSTGLLAAGSPGAGSLFPQPRVHSAARPGLHLLDDVVGVGALGVCVLVREAALGAGDAQRLQQALAPLHGSLLRLADAPSGALDSATPGLRIHEEATLMADWLASLNAAIAIVRPDKQVVATAPDVPQALVHLQTLTAALCAAR